METTKLFVALSHTLTPSQIDGFTAQYGVQSSLSDEDIEEMGLQEAYELPYKFVTTSVTLKEVALELQQRMSNIPATAGLSDIQTLAKAIVAEAVKAGATHFYCVGEPTLTMWANLYAGGHADVRGAAGGEEADGEPAKPVEAVAEGISLRRGDALVRDTFHSGPTHGASARPATEKYRTPGTSGTSALNCRQRTVVKS